MMILPISYLYWGRNKPGQIFDQDIDEYESDADDIYDADADADADVDADDGT